MRAQNSVSFNCVYNFLFLKGPFSSGALIASYFARTEMLFTNMPMHNVAIVCGRFIYFLKLFSYSEIPPRPALFLFL